jgi:hypothetical protein
MLNPRPARIPETRDNTPGSFCTRQFSTCLDWERIYFYFIVTERRISEECAKSPKEKEGGVAYFLYGCRLAGGVLYRMFVTASSADRSLGRSILGSGGGLTLCDVL